MVFPYGFIDIVIKRKALENVEKGLSDKFIKEYKVGEGRVDENLIVIGGSMGSGGEDEKIKDIETKYHIVHLKNDVAQDIVCTSHGLAAMSKCTWLKSGRLSEELKIGNTTFLKGSPFLELVE